MGFSNTVIGGASKLIRAAIQSPNYVAGLVGWSINKDGTAEFNDATFRGTIVVSDVNQSVLIYAGTPAVDNLILSIAPNAGTDAFGTNYPQGFATYARHPHGYGPMYLLNAFTGGNPATQGAYHIWGTGGGNGVPAGEYLIGSPGAIHLRTNSLSGYTDEITLDGNLIYLGRSYSKLWLGQPDIVSGLSSAEYAFGTGQSGRYMWLERSCTSQVIPSGASTVLTNLITFNDRTDYDAATAWDNTTGIFTAPVDGVYSMFGCVGYNAGLVAGTRMLMDITRNGVATANRIASTNAQAWGASGDIAVYARRYLLAGDTIRFRAYQASGAACTIVQDDRSFLTIQREW